jgi:hypothetical protein
MDFVVGFLFLYLTCFWVAVEFDSVYLILQQSNYLLKEGELINQQEIQSVNNNFWNRERDDLSLELCFLNRP